MFLASLNAGRPEDTYLLPQKGAIQGSSRTRRPEDTYLLPQKGACAASLDAGRPAHTYLFFGPRCACQALCGYEFAGYRWCYPRTLLFEFLPRFLVDLALPFALAFATCSFRLG